MKVNDYKMMPRVEADAVLDSTASAIQKAKKTAENLTTRLRIVESYLQIEEDALRHCTDVSISTNLQALSDETFSALRFGANDLQALSAFPPAAETSEDPSAEEERYYKKIVLPADKVLSFLEPDAIYVRTPMLWSRQNRKIRGSKGRTIGPERCVFYRNSVRYSIMIDPSFATYNFKKFEKKIVQYLYIYHDLPTNKMYLIDNDNHETKHVTDAIIQFLPAGDTPLACNFYSSAAITEAIPEGTYVTVTSFSDGIKSDEKIIAYWAEKYKDFSSQI